MQQNVDETRSKGRYGRLLRRFVAASAVATTASQLVFLASYALGALPVTSTVLAWLAGAIPNFLLNRRTWGGGGSAELRGQLLRFAMVSVSTALLAALATSNTETLALRLFPQSPPGQVILVWGAFLGTYLVMFVVKFFLFDRVVFTARRREPVR
ncbi:putative flippase GtrA [Saccharopolyspora lacisalsi]|uniref:Putative flippase GtrA n=1 Tax=Halosaccharopolyspora lacisalsi TaxID=1000566 RepID=A0A839E394_9PSEU|nr:GtrA family protein [Halosaccharopolyspora lacisalsi]MBA8825861.1 putative flippase GtrA [Halosaccharopolyspora lacisalsi]